MKKPLVRKVGVVDGKDVVVITPNNHSNFKIIKVGDEEIDKVLRMSNHRNYQNSEGLTIYHLLDYAAWRYYTKHPERQKGSQNDG